MNKNFRLILIFLGWLITLVMAFYLGVLASELMAQNNGSFLHK